MNKPAPPPEAVAIRLARKAAGISVAAAAEAAAIPISTARWSQIENGYETRPGTVRVVRGRDSTVAHMARVVDVTPAQLEDAGRSDAAEVLCEILRRSEPVPVAPERDLLGEVLGRHGVRDLDEVDGLAQIWAISYLSEPVRLGAIEAALQEWEQKLAEDRNSGHRQRNSA
jgi:hypothetical protein